MKILHYALGFPPYRSGGLTKFCFDLMRQQCADGHQAALLWPGQMGIFCRRVSVRDRGIVRFEGKPCGIRSFELINPLPVPYDEGIAAFDAFEKQDGQEAYERLLETFRPDVIHLHTLMGLHGSFLEAARRRKIRCVFTAHDFFPICPKVTMVHGGQVCPSAKSCSDCGICNATALPLKKIHMLQSPLYRALKDSSAVRGLRARHRDRYWSGAAEQETAEAVGTAEDYQKLRGYYYALLRLADVIHYNSSVVKSVYESFFDLPNSQVISISHGDIGDHRKKKEFIPGRLRMAYLGQQRKAKGFFLLQEALDELWKTNQCFSLNLYFSPGKLSPYMRVYRRYTYAELETVFDNTDLLLVPSIWKETFGYIVLEALSYGVPVLISGNVGARDILASGAGIVIEDISAASLCTCLREITSRRLSEMNEAILQRQEILTMRRMARDIEDKCYR